MKALLLSYPQFILQDTIPITSTPSAKKDSPRIIEKIIDKVENFLTATTVPLSSQQAYSEENDDVLLPKGTTITLPDGKSFETQIESKLSKT